MSRRPAAEQVVGPVLDPAGDLRSGRPAVGRVVLEPAVGGRVVRGRDDDAVGAGATAVVRQDRPRDGGRGRVAVARIDQHGDVVGREYLQRRDARRLGKRVRVGTQEQRAADIVRGPVVADRLAGGDDVVLVERRRERRTAVPGRPEADALLGSRRIGVLGVVRGDELGDIDEVSRGCAASRREDPSWLDPPAPRRLPGEDGLSLGYLGDQAIVIVTQLGAYRDGRPPDVHRLGRRGHRAAAHGAHEHRVRRDR